MLGIPLPIAAAAVLLVGQTATDAPFLANPVEINEIVLYCGQGPNPKAYWTIRFNPTTRVAYFAVTSRGRDYFYNRSNARREAQYVAFWTDQGMMRIDLEAMVYKVTREHGAGQWPSITVGVCKVP